MGSDILGVQMTTRPVRIVFDNRPYLVVRDDGGSLERACGPFAPGTEPNMAECGPDKAVHSSATLDRVGAVAADQPRASSGARHARPIVRRAASGRAIKPARAPSGAVSKSWRLSRVPNASVCGLR